MPRLLPVDVLKANVSYDPETGLFTRIKNHPKRKYLAGSVTGVPRPDGYIQVMIEGKIYLAHRLAWLYVHGEFPKDQIDHINHDRSDNRIENLRSVTYKENNQNRSKCNGTSKFVGIYWNKLENKWRSQISCNSTRQIIGSFHDEIEAALAYDEVARFLGFHENHLNFSI
jgi:hypothetical protein